MTIGPELGIAIMLNNYFHDVATALLASSGVAMWSMVGAWDRSPPGAGASFEAIYRTMSRLARLSLAWIFVGGVPRIYFYESFEWANAAGRGQVLALGVKHVLMFALVALGGVSWWRLRQRVAALPRG